VVVVVMNGPYPSLSLLIPPYPTKKRTKYSKLQPSTTTTVVTCTN
jgi:hypothetical protein